MKYTRERAAFIFGQEMEPCPKCGSYNIGPQMPIVLDISDEDLKDARKVVGKWARATAAGHTPLQGPCFLMCRDCAHHGPAVDCSGRTSEEVGQDPKVYAEMKRLWNQQEIQRVQ